MGPAHARLVILAQDGLAHGDLSAYNLLVHHGRLVMIDLPQVVASTARSAGAAPLIEGLPRGYDTAPASTTS